MSERNYTWETSAVRYQIGDSIFLNTHANCITHGENTIELEHRLVLLLVYFIHHQGEIIPKDVLLKTIWQGKVVNDDSLSVAVSHIRKALGDNSRSPVFIKTIPGVGYQFIASAQALPDEPVTATTLKKTKSLGVWLVAVALVIATVAAGVALSRPRVAQATPVEKLSAEAVAQLQEADRLLAKTDPESWRAAIKQYRDLISQHGESASALVGIGNAKIKLLGQQLVIKENCVEVVGLFQKAVDIDPNLSIAHRSLANATFWCQRDAASAEAHYLTALKLNPSDDEAAIFYAELLLAQKRFAESLEQVDRARRLNPLNYSVPVVVWIYQMQERDDLALQELQRILTTEPDNRYFHISAQRIFARMGDAKKVFAETKWLMKDSKFSDDSIAEAEQIFNRESLPGFYRWLLDRKETADLGDYDPPLSWARYALVAKDYEQALNYLEQAYEKRQYPILWGEVDPAYAPVRSHPRFQKILQQIKVVENK